MRSQEPLPLGVGPLRKPEEERPCEAPVGTGGLLGHSAREQAHPQVEAITILFIDSPNDLSRLLQIFSSFI